MRSITCRNLHVEHLFNYLINKNIYHKNYIYFTIYTRSTSSLPKLALTPNARQLYSLIYTYKFKISLSNTSLDLLNSMGLSHSYSVMTVTTHLSLKKTKVFFSGIKFGHGTTFWLVLIKGEQKISI